MKRHANAVWEGNLNEGKGKLSTESGVLAESSYSFHTRFEETPGTNPEELIAAAHAGCFSMALSAFLTEAGTPPQWIETGATVTLEKGQEGYAITGIHLDVKARVPNVDGETFLATAARAKEGCPVSRLLNAPISFEARLEA